MEKWEDSMEIKAKSHSEYLLSQANMLVLERAASSYGVKKYIVKEVS